MTSAGYSSFRRRQLIDGGVLRTEPCIQPVRGFANDQQIRPLLQQLTDHAAERLVVLDDENSNGGTSTTGRSVDG